jgi:hypothetical protein
LISLPSNGIIEIGEKMKLIVLFLSISFSVSLYGQNKDQIKLKPNVLGISSTIKSKMNRITSNSFTFSDSTPVFKVGNIYLSDDRAFKITSIKSDKNGQVISFTTPAPDEIFEKLELNGPLDMNKATFEPDPELAK